MGKTAVGLGIRKTAAGANAVEVAKAVKARMQERYKGSCRRA